MILAVIPLIPLAWVAGVGATAGIIGWIKGRSKRRKELKKQEKENEKMKHRLAVMAARQKQHEDDLNGVIANLETGQTAEEEEFGIFPKKYASKQINKTVKDDKVDDRFELLDL
jgi:flagellar biosynthesis component FlhA